MSFEIEKSDLKGNEYWGVLIGFLYFGGTFTSLEKKWHGNSYLTSYFPSTRPSAENVTVFILIM